MASRQWLKLRDDGDDPLYLDLERIESIMVVINDDSDHTVTYEVRVIGDSEGPYFLNEESWKALTAWLDETIWFDSKAYSSAPPRLKL